MSTHGQLINGKRISLSDFQTSVGTRFKNAIGTSAAINDIAKLYKKGMSVDDAVSHLIMKS